MEMTDSGSKLPSYLIFSGKKLLGVILQTFEVFIWRILQVEDIVQADNFLYHIDLVDGTKIGELATRSGGKTQILYCCYFIIATLLSFKAYCCPSCIV